MSDKVTDKVSGKVSDKVSGKVSDKVSDKVADKVSDKVSDKVTEGEEPFIRGKCQCPDMLSGKWSILHILMLLWTYRSNRSLHNI